ncbi:glucose-6-phosphate isomerase [Thioflexithrix psekupsensis]|uniref:Glucose-6-phosphate isomerase n=1 Tax=Thioflexithrix psekupsensis TaxID=1570016 RepID=A0A251X605_9GAMM|nr:glucose-6-phosphate isomerase [Thioflexithrix psekupsensis]OUD13175.1 glucose-6-phosphate isomerase [Thioflexithrix psekupsensis]
MSILVSNTPAWQALQQHQKQWTGVSLRHLFDADSSRFSTYSVENSGLLLDYSRNYLNAETRTLLLALAEQMQLSDWIKRLYQGDEVNHTEHRAALHMALRHRGNAVIRVNGKDVMPEVQSVLQRMKQFVTAVHQGEWRGFTGKRIESVVNIGIGGSDLGPVMVTRALKAYHIGGLRIHFVSNVDSTHLMETIAELNPETTLFIIASKTFSTQETMLNANSARDWFLSHAQNPAAVAQHFVAISTAKERVSAFGIDTKNMFEFWDWVGGRFSLWSAIGLPIALAIGMEQFEEFLHGAYLMDEHFYHAPFDENLPVLLGLIGVWNSSFLGAATQVILPYDFALEHLPAYLQQLKMESLGKRVTRHGDVVDYATCPIIWGAAGNNGQHAFYQLLHQGTHLIPADFIIAAHSQRPLGTHQAATLSNALAQILALMHGRNAEETQTALRASGLSEQEIVQQLSHRTFPGNQPSNTLLYQRLSPAILGALIALYEHKVFVQSVCWDLNPFDQWGVELGKQVANGLLPALLGQGQVTLPIDGSTQALLQRLAR